MKLQVRKDYLVLTPLLSIKHEIGVRALGNLTLHNCQFHLIKSYIFFHSKGYKGEEAENLRSCDCVPELVRPKLNGNVFL